MDLDETESNSYKHHYKIILVYPRSLIDWVFKLQWLFSK